MIPKKTFIWQRVWPPMLTVFGVGLVGVCAWPYTVDDSYIVARYAQRLSQGLGYTWNPGHATDGVTGPAWLIPGVLATVLGLDPVLAAKVAGLVCAAAAAYVCVAGQRRRARGEALAVLTGLLLVCQPSLGGSGSSGLETGAATIAFTVAAQAAFAAPKPRSVALGAAVAALAWLRPELALGCGALLATACFRVGWRRLAGAWVLTLASAAAVCLFRVRIHGSILPLAWYAKAGSLSDGFFYAARACLVLSGGLGVGLAFLGARRGHCRDRARGWTLVVHIAAVVLAGGDWMPGFRLFVPVFPQYAALAAAGAERLWRRGGYSSALAGAGLVAACGIPLLDLALRLPEWQRAGHSRVSVGAEIAGDLREHSKRVALVDIGYLGYTSGVETIDLAGLTEPAVAAFPGGHLAKRIDAAWLSDQAPDTLVLHSSVPPLAAEDGRLVRLRGYPVEMRVAQFDWVMREFRVAKSYLYGPGYYYVVLRKPLAAGPRGDTPPP